MNKRQSIIKTTYIILIFAALVMVTGFIYNIPRRFGNDSAVETSSSSDTESSQEKPVIKINEPDAELSHSSTQEESSEESLQKDESSDDYEQERNQQQEEPKEIDELEEARQKAAYEKFNDMIGKELSQNAAEIAAADEILQYPELPTGCESVALTIALNSLGFQLDKTTIAEDYLIYGDDFTTSYLGDPFSDGGAGIYPPGLVQTAENFLKDNSSDLTAIDTTGTELSDLYKLIENGCPVLIWTTMYLDYPYFTGQSNTYNGVYYPWYMNEHCIVLYGYNRDYNTVYISDPLEGYNVCDASYFEEIYDEIGQFSMTIIK